MPVSLSTTFTGRVALPLDNSRLKAGDFFTVPAPIDPQFEVRFLSQKSWTELNAATAFRKETLDEHRTRIVAAIAPHVVALHNMPAGASLDDLVDGEIDDLADEILKNSKLGYDDAKKSKLPPSSGLADSAKDAGTASAATTSPA
jgi:hypothetical protein